MCTAISFKTKDHYFGRTLDYEKSFGERVVITPRNYPLQFRHLSTINEHLAIIGMAVVEDAYPLYFEATNEKGLSIAGLNFPGNACYYPIHEQKYNVASFELIPWILGQCNDIGDAKRLIGNTNVSDTHFCELYPTSPLHWLVADKFKSLVIECRWNGMFVYDNPVGVLTNNPPFESQFHQLQNYPNVSCRSNDRNPFGKYSPSPYSRGMGTMGLPGDFTSTSRFVRAAFAKANSMCSTDEQSSVSQFFHILGYAEQVCGCVEVTPGIFEYTRYVSCCNTDRGLYYYKTYNNSRLSCVSLFDSDVKSNVLAEHPLKYQSDIYYQN